MSSLVVEDGVEVALREGRGGGGEAVGGGSSAPDLRELACCSERVEDLGDGVVVSGLDVGRAHDLALAERRALFENTLRYTSQPRGWNAFAAFGT
jgi:hypothetical protein